MKVRESCSLELFLHLVFVKSDDLDRHDVGRELLSKGLTNIAVGGDEFDAIVDAIRTSAQGVWLDLWAGAVAINAMCVGASGRAGVAVMAQGLKITLTTNYWGVE